MPNVELCPGCEHDMRRHFTSVTGDVICLVSHSGTSSSGVIGIPWTTHCDCVNHESPSTNYRRERDAKEKREHDEFIAQFAESIRKGIQETQESADHD